MEATLENPGAIDQLLSMSNEALYALVLVFFVPFLMGVINRTMWQPLMKLIAVWVVCVAASAGWFIAQGEWDTGDWFRMTLLVMLGAQVIYKLYERSITILEEHTG